MDNRVDTTAEGSVNCRAVRNRSNYLGIGAGRDIETGDGVARVPQSWREKPAEPSGRAGEEYMHEAILTRRCIGK